jgi:competence protein ComEC
VGSDIATLRAAAFVLPVLAIATLAVAATRLEPSPYAIQGLVLLAALGVGYARHQVAVRLAPNHVAHLATDEPVVTRLAGRVVTQPTTFPAEKRNPFLPFDPAPRTRFVLAANELHTTDPPTPISGYVRVSVEAEGIEAGMGDVVVLTGTLYRPRGPRNPGETDWAYWNRSQNVYAGMSVDGVAYVRRVDQGSWTAHGLIGSLRAKAQSLLFAPFEPVESDEPRRLLDAMVLGHRSAAGRVLNEAFLRTGSIHFLTVSGFHVGALAFTAWFFVRRILRGGSRVSAVVTAVVIVAYALVAEPNAPVLRAATMGVLLCVAQLTQRPFCGINWLAFSAVCILAYNPLELFRAGFQLSFVQVLALLTIVPHLYRAAVRHRPEHEVPADADTYARLVARWVWRWLVGLVVVCVCAWIIALPLVLYHFGRFAPWGAVQTIFVSPVVVVTIVLGFVTLVTLMILPPVGAVLGIVLREVTGFLLSVVGVLSRLPGTLVEVRRPPAAFVILAYAGLVTLAWLVRTRAGRGEKQPPGGPSSDHRAGHQSWAGRFRGWIARLARDRQTLGALFGVMLVFLAVGVAILSKNCPPGVALHVLSVGSGAATLMTTSQGDAALLDAGTIHNFDAGETVTQAARALGIDELKLLAVSHANFDHYSGVPTVLEKLATERLVFNSYFERSADDNAAVRRLLEMLPARAPPATIWRAGDEFALGEVTLEVLWPPADLPETWKPNNRSLVVRVEAYGRRVLLTGDVERDALRALLNLHAAGRIDLTADVLIAPHHGSVVPGETGAFYKAVSPDVVVVSTSRERPKLQDLVQGLFGDAVRLLSTDDVGAVCIQLLPTGEVEVQTPFAPTSE